MLFQATNIIPDVRTGIGLGTVDVTQGITFSWQVSGDYPVLTGYQIDIYQNDAASTLIQTIGPVTLGTPFNGTDSLGNPQIFSVTVAAGSLSASITNGNEYKYVITQYYSGGSVRQSSASVFLTRETPSLGDMTQYGLPLPEYPGDSAIAAPDILFRVSYSQANGDVLEWIRFTVTETLDGVSRLFFDSGNIYTPGPDAAQLPAMEYTMLIGGFMTIYAEGMSGLSYTFEATGQTSSGVPVSTGQTVLRATYTFSTSTTKKLSVTCDRQHNAVLVDLSKFSIQGANAVRLYRSGGQSGASMQTVAEDFPQGGDTDSVYDYAACSTRGPYSYYCFVNTSSLGWVCYPWSDDNGNALSISPVFARWTLLVCTENTDGSYTVDEEYSFKDNLESGSVSNNNSPYVAQNFTGAPIVQISPQNYRSGSLTALAGSAGGGRYTDTYAQRAALTALSTSQKPMFLKSSKGDLMQVRISGPVTFAIAEGTPSLAQTVTVPWVEIGDASMERITTIVPSEEATLEI